MKIYETIDSLTAEYARWNKANGLNLGSADEHLNDDNLTQQQRNWLRQFCMRWNNAAI